ncbi:odv-ec43 [Clostera anastomosis granulovirus B]|uniref:Odv-ec43 n=1 Tax=Clostera anastomosis granulovirus B TaxID=1986290 RepID=A0A0K0WS68_9BBAC|nr:odv-ec43 [Clostera anastomosis granulovirus B]AKS25386.1 odv-ec43 [Clostera anastomosis granulovirus B]
MACHGKLQVYISNAFILFPYEKVTPEPNSTSKSLSTHLTIFVPTYADEKVITKEVFVNFNTVRVVKYVSTFSENDEETKNGTVVYWNVIVPIRVTGVGVTKVFSVVLSDNLYSCHSILIDNNQTLNNMCPLQVDYEKNMVCLKGELAGDFEELNKAFTPAYTSYLLHFDKETPMGIKILNTKRFLIALSFNRKTHVKVCVYLTYEELTIVHKELSWESVRRQIRGGSGNSCTVLTQPSYKYVIDALQLLGVGLDKIGAIHTLVDTFTPLILHFKLVPDIFVELNKLNGHEKHVRLYCKYEGVSVTNAGPVPLNLPTKNKLQWTHKPLVPPLPSFYQEIGNRNVYVYTPVYNYFL